MQLAARTGIPQDEAVVWGVSTLRARDQLHRNPAAVILVRRPSDRRHRRFEGPSER
jgi:hypothetical protein